MESLIYILILTSIAGIGFAVWKYSWLIKQEEGNDKLKKNSNYISDGVKQFLQNEYKVLLVIGSALGILLFFKSGEDSANSVFSVISYLVGAGASLSAIYISSLITSKAGIRVANASQNSKSEAFKMTFAGSLVGGITTVSIGLLTIGALFFVLNEFGFEVQSPHVLGVLSGYALGASVVSLFLRVSGGVFSNSSNKGAIYLSNDGFSIPKNSSLNPATTNENVGSVAGNTLGQGADVFESLVASIIATMILGASFIGVDAFQTGFKTGAVLLPMALAGSGIIVAIIGSFFIFIKEQGNAKIALNIGEYITTAILSISSFFIIKSILPTQWITVSETDSNVIETTYTYLGVFYASLIGIIASLGMNKIIEYYTTTGTRSVISILKHSTKGSAGNILGGIETGIQSTIIPIGILLVSVLSAYYFSGMYGIAIAAVGFLANSAIQFSIQSFGAITHNADTISKTSELEPEAIQGTIQLKTVGITKSSTAKGFAIASAALTAFAIIPAFMQEANIKIIDIYNPLIISALLLGALLPLFFSSIIIGGAVKIAEQIKDTVVKQFDESPQLKQVLEIFKKYKSDISLATEQELELINSAENEIKRNELVKETTNSSIKEIIIAGVLSITVPVLVGYFGGAEMLGGLVIGVTVSGVVLAFFQTNTGSALYSAKKMIEEDITIDDSIYSRGSDIHSITKEGDNVGSTLRDASGASLGFLIKMTAIVALVLAPSIAFKLNTDNKAEVNIEKQVIETVINSAEGSTTIK